MKTDITTLNYWDKSYSWHPFTQMQEYLERKPVHITHAKGCWLYDIEGKRYLDGNASNWTNVHGHSDQELNEALIQQLKNLQQSSYKDLNHPAASQLCHELTSIAPEGLNRCFFTDNGASSVEAALKLSFQYWQLTGNPQKKLIIGMEGSYHGDTFGAMSAGNSLNFHQRFSEWFLPAYHFAAPQHDDMSESLQDLDRLLETYAEQTAILFLEPSVQGPRGMYLQPPGFLQAVSERCKIHNIHLALDEIFVGLGRLGHMLVCAAEDLTPDFLCLSKTLTGGYLPLAATLTTQKIYNAFLGEFSEEKTFLHGHTFAANPLSTAVSIKNIEKLRRRIQSGELQRTCDHFSKNIKLYFSKHPFVKSVRQRGLACAIELYPGINNNLPTFDINERVAHHLSLYLRDKEILLRGIGNTLLIIPPLCITELEIVFLCKQTATSISEYIHEFVICRSGIPLSTAI
ncbi:adenosylmethionine--8-amino-7-oxononanoate transaminase [Rickettsiella endosymbiont of Rhagonycha lignosa]|uniref:adenosylmethionine--8-amino-7-oxononanoate transaminase n=1 Tax=Rickettsiella endosymbiont of Rhagonycha lignosa TaxID=3077937 RepID=UPI00313AAADD